MSFGKLSCVSGSSALAGLAILAAAWVAASSAHDQCRNHQDHAAAPGDPRYPALQQAVDAYFAERQKAEGFSGISLHVSFSATGPALDFGHGSTSLQDGDPSVRIPYSRSAASPRASPPS